jgi:putative transposase
MNPHFKALEAAYQLHFYFCLKTHFLKPHLATHDAEKLVVKVLERVCQREQYHVLQLDVSATQLRFLLSLKPTHAVSQVVRLLKGNLERDFRHSFKVEKLLGRGYFVRSSGKASLEAARKYVESQVHTSWLQGRLDQAVEIPESSVSVAGFQF